MTELLLEAIVNGAQGITISISAKDLKEVVAEMITVERKRIKEEAERRRERYGLSRGEAAALLRVSLGTLWRMEKDGSLMPRRSGRKVFYRQSDIEEYREQQKKDRL